MGTRHGRHPKRRAARGGRLSPSGLHGLGSHRAGAQGSHVTDRVIHSGNVHVWIASPLIPMKPLRIALLSTLLTAPLAAQAISVDAEREGREPKAFIPMVRHWVIATDEGKK